MYQSHKQQTGVVIVIALFIVALIASMSYVMLARIMRDTERTLLITRNLQAENLSEGATLWATDLLTQNWTNQKENQIIDKMPVVAPKMQVNGFVIQSIIDDAEARYNINNLVDAKEIPHFATLINSVDKEMPVETAMSIAKALNAWLQQPDSMLDEYYLKLKIPYRPAHRLMQSSSELQLVKDVTPQLFYALKPYIVALPITTKINIQTASAYAFVAAAPQLTLEAAQQLIKSRSQKPFVTVNDLSETPIAKNFQLKTDNFTNTSQFFIVETKLAIENQQIVFYTLLQRQVINGKAVVTRLWQSKGVW